MVTLDPTRDISEYAKVLIDLQSEFNHDHYPGTLEWCGVAEKDENDLPWYKWLIRDDGEPIGICGLYELGYPSDTAWLGWLGIIANRRHLGFGSEVMRLLELEARCLAYKNLAVWIYSHQRPKNYYLRNGFLEVGTVADYCKATSACREDFNDDNDVVLVKALF